MTATGWSWEYIDEHMDLRRLDAMNRSWVKHPPVHVSVANYLGAESSKAKSEVASDFEFDTMMASIPSKEMRPDGH